MPISVPVGSQKPRCCVHSGVGVAGSSARFGRVLGVPSAGAGSRLAAQAVKEQPRLEIFLPCPLHLGPRLLLHTRHPRGAEVSFTD